MAPSDWASLPSDLVRRAADVFLPTSDLDYYMSLRAVCRYWRTVTDNPRGPDPRFSPCGWVLVESLAGDDHSGRRCLFLHVDTGRFLWKDQPILHSYTVITSTEDGHLVLEPASRNSRICLLNPITGHVVHFPVTTAQFLGDKQFGLRHGRSIFAAGSSSTVLYRLFDSSSGGCIDLTWDAVFNRESLFRAPGTVATMMPFKGCAYTVNDRGSIAVVEHNCRLDEKPEVTTIVVTKQCNLMHDCRAFLVNNAGEMLLVRLLESKVRVFRVDFEKGVLEQIKSIGNHAIFLGGHHCLSVDAYSLPTVECNCIYYIGAAFDGRICVHNLDDSSHMELFESIREVDAHSPKSLSRVLMEYACYGIKP